LGVGPNRPDALLIGEAPAREDVRAGEPFSGPTGREMEALLLEAGLDRERLFLLNAIACLPNEPRREKEYKVAVKCCRPLMLATLARLPPETPTLVMGATALASLDLKERSVAANRGFLEYDWTLDHVVKT